MRICFTTDRFQRFPVVRGGIFSDDFFPFELRERFFDDGKFVHLKLLTYDSYIDNFEKRLEGNIDGNTLIGVKFFQESFRKKGEEYIFFLTDTSKKSPFDGVSYEPICSSFSIIKIDESRDACIQRQINENSYYENKEYNYTELINYIYEGLESNS